MYFTVIDMDITSDDQQFFINCCESPELYLQAQLRLFSRNLLDQGKHALSTSVGKGIKMGHSTLYISMAETAQALPEVESRVAVKKGRMAVVPINLAMDTAQTCRSDFSINNSNLDINADRIAVVDRPYSLDYLKNAKTLQVDFDRKRIFIIHDFQPGQTADQWLRQVEKIVKEQIAPLAACIPNTLVGSELIQTKVIHPFLTLFKDKVQVTTQSDLRKIEAEANVGSVPIWIKPWLIGEVPYKVFSTFSNKSLDDNSISFNQYWDEYRKLIRDYIDLITMPPVNAHIQDTGGMRIDPDTGETIFDNPTYLWRVPNEMEREQTQTEMEHRMRSIVNRCRDYFAIDYLPADVMDRMAKMQTFNMKYVATTGRQSSPGKYGGRYEGRDYSLLITNLEDANRVDRWKRDNLNDEGWVKWVNMMNKTAQSRLSTID